MKISRLVSCDIDEQQQMLFVFDLDAAPDALLAGVVGRWVFPSGLGHSLFVRDSQLEAMVPAKHAETLLQWLTADDAFAPMVESAAELEAVRHQMHALAERLIATSPP